MELIILVGVWALAFGHMSITNTLKFKGQNARAFGIALILVAAYGLPHLNSFLGGILPKAIKANEAFSLAYPSLVGVLAIYVTGWVMTRFYPKLRVPAVIVSIKRGKKAA